MKAVGIVPARMGSSRFPGKPLIPILGTPMIEHIYHRARMCEYLSDVFIATCDREIADAVTGFGATALMTSDKHQRASDRVAEAARALDADVVVMLQGDEPMITPEMIDTAVETMIEHPDVVCCNLAREITDPSDLHNPSTIKVVMDVKGNALYFSREPIPHTALLGAENVPLFKQVCVIPFRRDFLLRYAALSQTPLEQAESVDMLRILEHGYSVRMVPTDVDSHAVDVPADVALVETLMRQDPLLAQYR